MRPARALAAIACGAAASAALACGVCAEDKIAATYDYAAEHRAVASGRAVVYCSIEGRFDTGALKESARRVAGVAAQTLRISRSPAALSFVLDTKKQSAAAAVRAMAARAGARLTVLKVAQPTRM